MPGHPVGICRGSQGPPLPPQVLGVAPDGGAGGRVLQRTLTRRERHDTVGPTVTHHIQCGGGCVGPPLGVLGSGTGGGDRSDNNNDVAQPSGKTIRARDDGQWRAEEGNVRLKLKVAFFYADEGLVASTDPRWLQYAFNMLTGLFE